MKNGKIKTSLRLICFLLLTVLAGCAVISPHMPHDDANLPPVLAQDEVLRAYDKLGAIQITRTVYVTDGLATPDIREWGFMALRREAAKMGADAVIFPEVAGTHSMTTMLPATEYRASGFAIKFK